MAIVLRKIALGLQPCHGKKMKSKIVKKGFVYISHYKEPWVNKKASLHEPQNKTQTRGSAHMGQKHDSAKQHAEGQQIPCKPNCICKLNGLKLPTNVQRKKSQQYDANEFQQHEAKKISSIRPYNLKKK